jgi:hypothetical protein
MQRNHDLLPPATGSLGQQSNVCQIVASYVSAVNGQQQQHSYDALERAPTGE